MKVTTLHEVEEALRGLEPDELHEMAYQMARSHAEVCGLTSRVGGCSHIPGEETRDRVDGMTASELAELLAPTAWIAAQIHSRFTS